MATTEELAKEKQIKKILKDFFKFNKHFKEAPVITNCDAILIFNKNDLKSYHIVVCNETEKHTDLPPVDDDSCKLVYLKNTNTHDSKKTTRG